MVLSCLLDGTSEIPEFSIWRPVTEFMGIVRTELKELIEAAAPQWKIEREGEN